MPSPSPRLCRILPLFLLLGWTLGSAAEADRAAAALAATAEIEAELLEAELLRYADLRRLTDAASRDFEALDRELDRALVGDGRTAAELRQLEARLNAQRDNIYGLERQLETLRRSIYGHMDRVAALRGAGDRLEAERPKSAIDGTWAWTTSAGESGYAQLTGEGALVRGTYKLNDSTGSLRGTLVGVEVELEQIDRSRGFDRLLSGTLAGARIEGNWIATEIGGGRPESGTWTARKLSRDEARAVGSPAP